MSGGAFDYKQYNITEIARICGQRLARDRAKGWISPEYVGKVKEAIHILHRAYAHAQAADYAFSGDTGWDKSFDRHVARLLKQAEMDAATDCEMKYDPSEEEWA